VNALGIGETNPLPTPAGPHQGRVHELQATPRLEETRDDLGAPALFQKTPLDQIRGACVLVMGDGQAQMGETRLQIVAQRGHRRRVDPLEARGERRGGLPARLGGRLVADRHQMGLDLGPRTSGTFSRAFRIRWTQQRSRRLFSQIALIARSNPGAAQGLYHITSPDDVLTVDNGDSTLNRVVDSDHA
jgi:hypothetical protein